MQSQAINSNTQFASSDLSNSSVSSSRYPRAIRVLFFIFALYLVLPIVDFPMLGLSLSAPIFFIIAVACVFKPPRSWFSQYQHWILFAVVIWAGIFIATAANGLLSGGVAINSEGILTVLRYAYWMLVFVITAYFASQGNVVWRTTQLLGWGILCLALLRWAEVLLYHNIGAWTGTHFLSQNDYGFLFSTFSPFLLFFLLQESGSKLLLAITANIIVWGAVAINGSRGSWVSMAAGLMVALFILFRARSRRFGGLFAGLLFVTSISAALLFAFPKFSSAVLERAGTLQSLDTDKSYAIRRLMNQKALLLFQESPLIGVGTARFRLSSIPLEIPRVLSYASQEHFDRKSAHNSYLGFLAEHGLVGTVPFGLLLIMLTVKAFKFQSQLIRQHVFWGLAIFLSFLQMSIHMCVISSLANTANWFVYGLVGTVITLAEAQRNS